MCRYPAMRIYVENFSGYLDLVPSQRPMCGDELPVEVGDRDDIVVDQHEFAHAGRASASTA